MKKEIQMHGQPVSIELQMWSRRTRDMIDRKHGMAGSVYINQVIGVLAKESKSPVARDMLMHLVEKERNRQDETGSDYAIDAICACVRIPKGDTTQVLLPKEVADLPDDEFEALNDMVMDFLVRRLDKVLILKTGLTNMIKDEKLAAQVLKFIDEVMSGQVESKN